MSTQPRADPWAELSQGLEITGVRVAATLRRRVMVEELARLICREGRLLTFKFLPEGELHTLEYAFGFEVPGAGEPCAATLVPARMEIRGWHWSGCLLEISGGGWIGHDEKGKLGGRFDTPPAIVAHDHAGEALEAGCTIIPFPVRPQILKVKAR